MTWTVVSLNANFEQRELASFTTLRAARKWIASDEGKTAIGEDSVDVLPDEMPVPFCPEVRGLCDSCVRFGECEKNACGSPTMPCELSAKQVELFRSLGTEVHYADYASQPNIHLCCGDAPWTVPTWNQKFEKHLLPHGVHEADDGRLYSFTKELVTCCRCIAEPKQAEVGL